MYLWAKCIRTKIYKKTIYKLGKEKYSRHMKRYEDIVMTYALFNTARSYKFVGKYGIFHIYTPSFPYLFIKSSLYFFASSITSRGVLSDFFLKPFVRITFFPTMKKYNTLLISVPTFARNSNIPSSNNSECGFL